jgi:hypothetical protein
VPLVPALKRSKLGVVRCRLRTWLGRIGWVDKEGVKRWVEERLARYKWERRAVAKDGE